MMTESDRVIGFSVAEVQRQLQCGKSKVYELLGAGSLRAIKCGRRTLITRESLDAFVATLPPANITTGRRPAAKAAE